MRIVKGWSTGTDIAKIFKSEKTGNDIFFSLYIDFPYEKMV